ncbi:MAG: hypothetical protein H7256_10095 [Bdellovibrio sp.]|nr:hypothetical protein [Bdellovibrio sp.]
MKSKSETEIEFKKSKTTMKAFLRSFLMPTLIGKSLVLYFGINYSLSPDEGYGYGLAASIAFTFCSLVLFAWKYRNHEEL